MGSVFYGCCHTTAIPISLNWFGHEIKGITMAVLVEMCFE
jgi:hypothetical protein